MGGASILSGFAPTIVLLGATRFAAGVGAAFFFAPALSLVSSYYPSGERGPVIGTYNAAFNVGGGIGLVAGAAAGSLLGWSPVLWIGGIAVLLSAVAVWRVLPPGPDVPMTQGVSQLIRTASGVLRSRRIWMLATSLLGFWAVVNVLGLYFVQFAHDARPGWGVGAAASLAAAVVLISAPGGPLGGWLSERGVDRRTLAATFAALTAGLLLAVPFLSFALLVPILLLFGLVNGVVFAVQYTIPTYYLEASGNRAALAIGLVNSVQVLVGSGITALFGFVVEMEGYTSAWILIAVIGLALLPLMLFAPSVVSPRPPPAFPRPSPDS